MPARANPGANPAEFRPDVPAAWSYALAMHPLVSIGLVFLTGFAWMGTVVILLVSLAKARRRSRTRAGNGTGSPEAQKADAAAART